jgi:hypothetical protein
VLAASSAPIVSARGPHRGSREGVASARVALAQAPAASLQTPEQFLGFKVGADTKLARWDKIVQYIQLVASASDRVRVRELGKTTNGNPFISVEISAPDTLKNTERFKQLERRLYFQGGAPTDTERDEIFRSGKAVVLVTCNIHSTEIGSSQMAIELVHRLATENSPLVRKILDNVIFILVPSLNPDGQIMVTDWYNKNLGTEHEGSSMPWLYHPYVGHDDNRDAYMLTQKESQLVAKLLWHDWFPSVWLDEHQQSTSGSRIFVMPATDPINPNVHPLIYRWNNLLGQAQAAALEAAGKDGIIYNATYTNYWEGAMAWAGWWHNQIGLLTEVASVRIASPTDQQRAQLGQPPPTTAGTPGEGRGGGGGRGDAGGILPPPRDVMPRTEYPRPWLGGRWTLRDIVDYELIATMGLLEAAADRRETLLRQIYEVNRSTIENGRKGDLAAILIPLDAQQDPRQAVHLVEKLQLGGVDVYRAEAAFEADGKSYPAGTFVIPMTQVFARYAKDMLEKQTYPEVRRTPTSPPEPPYDVTAWSLGMLVGADTVFVKKALPDNVRLQELDAVRFPKGEVTGNGQAFAFDYRGPDTAIAINRLLKDGARVTLGPSASRVQVAGVPRKRIEAIAADFGLKVRAIDGPKGAMPGMPVRAPRVGLYQSWTANMDEGWTRWVLEQYEFAPKTLHNEDVRAGKLREKFDVIVLPDQQPRDILDGNSSRNARKEYQGGIGSEGLAALKAFVADGGTLVTLGSSCDFAIENWPIPVRNLKRGLSRDQHYAPGTIVRVQADTSSPLACGVAADTYGFYNNSPFLSVVDGFPSQKTSVLVRYPNRDIAASGWLKGEELMVGQAAVVMIETNPGRVVLFGLRPQHRAQTQATFPLLFNALFLSTTAGRGPGT